MSFIFETLVPNQNIQVIISAIIAMLISWRSIPVIINISVLRKLMDNPVKRSSHNTPTPTFGGVAIFASVLISYMVWNFGDEGNLIHRALAGTTILFFLGIKDDLYALSPAKKIIVQMLSSSLVVFGSDLRIANLAGIFGIHEIPYLISAVFTIILFVAMINAFNLIDGIDGLAGGIGMIASLGFGSWFLINNHYSLACLSLSLAGALAGFLRFNFSKTNKIFMGDTGSLIIGYIITILAVKFIHFNLSHSWVSNIAFVSAPILAIVLLIVPIYDTIRVFTVRILRGKSPFKADRLHMHHLLIDNGLTHKKASFSLYLLTVAVTLITYFARSYFSNSELCIFILILLASYFLMGSWLEQRRLKLKKKGLQSINRQSNDIVTEKKLQTIDDLINEKQ